MHMEIIQQSNKPKKSKLSTLLHDNIIYESKQSICDQFNNHFINVGNGLAHKLPKHDICPSVYIDRTITANSFMFRGICRTEVYDEIISLKVNESALDIPRKCIKHTASEYFRKVLNFQK